MSSVNVRYCDIPEYLRKGEFFRSLTEDDPDGIIAIPTDCFIETVAVADLEQFTQLLHVMVFWMLDNIPLGVVEFCSDNHIEVWRDVIMNLPSGDKSSLVQGLLATFSDQNEIRFYDALGVGDWDVIATCVDVMNSAAAENAMMQAAQYGNLRALKLLHEKRVPWNEDTCTIAALNDRLNCLQFAHVNGCPWDEAAQNGYLHCLQLLHHYNAPWDSKTCEYAAMTPDVFCLQYLHENGCSWDKQTTTHAARYGNIETLQYALENGCEHNENLMIGGVVSGNIECLQYLIEVQGLYMNENGTLFHIALLKGNLQCLQYLIDQGCPYHNANFSSDDKYIELYDILFIKSNPEFVQCLQYAVERGWCMDQNCIDYLVSRDWDNCREYLTQEGYVTQTTLSESSTEESVLKAALAVLEQDNVIIIDARSVSATCACVIC